MSGFPAWILLALLPFCTPTRAHGADRQLVGYLGSQDWGRDIEVGALTQLDCAFVVPNADGAWGDLDRNDSRNLARTAALRTKNAGLKVLISVGGWSGSSSFSAAAATDDARRRFARSAVAFVKKYALDGVDVDWEYPGQPGAGNGFTAQDGHNFTLLLATLREALDAAAAADGTNRYLLTAATGVDRAFLDHTELAESQRALDFVNLMAYDIYNGNDPTTGHLAGLYRSRGGDDRFAVDDAVSAYLAAGVPAGKLVLGFPFYGRGWSGAAATNDGLYQPASGRRFETSAAELTGDADGRNGYESRWDDEAKAAYLWNARSRTFISYPEPRSFAIKTAYLKSRGLAGAMFWEYGQDAPGRPLLKSLADGLKD